MYVVGHFLVTERTNLFSDAELYGRGPYALMLPDYVRCHDWGYQRCFQAESFPPTLDGAMIRAHLLGDWYVHYGGDTLVRKRQGWAYRNMAVYARRYHEFFTRAAERGLREDGPPADSTRGFSRTMVEYSVDTFLARRGDFNARFAEVRKSLGSLGKGEGMGSRTWLRHTLDSQSIEHDSPGIDSDIESFRERITCSERAEDFALQAAVKKFGLTPGPESADFVRSYLDYGLSEFSDTSLSSFVDECTEFLAQWLSDSPGRGEPSWI